MDVREQYFNWMYDMVFTKRAPSYVRLLRYLNSQEFTYNIRLDGNRADDGLYLRYRFKQENHLRAVDVDRYLTGNHHDYVYIACFIWILGLYPKKRRRQ